MTPEHWQKIEEIFQAALELAGDERARFVDRECGDDAALRSEVEKYIARFEAEDSFLESPVWTDSRMFESGLRKDFASSLEEIEPPADTFAGRQIGVYRLIEELGKGGMGVVYLAERADGEFDQKVAIKLIKRGMDTDFILRRFRQERQIAATLNHPNIARLLDGGTTSDNLPYFVLEYIDGHPLFKYTEAGKLNLRRKLELFLQICAAIAYAHRKRIIHRDIKPGNILVAEDGEPKLLDFGIAKILDPDLIHETAMPTATQMRLMTPEYASPEQVRGDEITEASDQYSLGVLLYELLTGRRPYKFPSRAPHEIARIICEEIPSEPSSGAFGAAVTRDKESASFDPDFCQKLDRIVLKSLRKNPSERYASVNDLIADIERFLRNEPIRAEILTVREKRPVIPVGNNAKISPANTNQKSIAVLPFKILDAAAGADTGDGVFFGIGLADALITRLSNVRQFIVRPTSSVLRFNDAGTDSFAAGRELNVAFVLDGRILKTEKRIRISVQLLNVAASSTVWAERFDEDLTDVLTLEDKISAKVAELLVPHLTTGERQKLAKRGTDQPKAYEAYLRGRFYRNMFTEESFSKAFDAYREAISYDSEYALAYAGIADYYLWLGVYGIMPPQECHPLAKKAALRAIEIDDGLAEAYASLAFAQICGDYDWVEAEKNAVRAVELNPHYAVGRLWYSYILQTAGRFDEGIVQAKRAIDLDPLTYTNHHVLALNYYMARRFEEAARQAAENVKNFPGIGMAFQTQSWILRGLGRTEESLEASRKAIELMGESLFVLISQAQALAAAGRRRESKELLKRILHEGEHQYISYYQIALVNVYAGEKDQALQSIERAFKDREGWLIWLNVEPAFDSLRREPRFIEVQRRFAGGETMIADGETGFSVQQMALPLKDSKNEKSIAVLPLKDLNTFSGEDAGESDYLNVGLADTLITRLSNARKFIVRPTSSVLRFAGAHGDSFAAGRELNVDYILDGNILRAGKKIRISIQLLDVAGHSTVWAERFDENLVDVLSLEDLISAKVVKSLIPQLSPAEAENLARRGTDSPEAYQAYLRGRAAWNTFSEEGLNIANGWYRQAIALDPSYAQVQAAIADYYIWLGIYYGMPPKEAYPAAKAAAQRAIELDDKLAEAYAALGLAQIYSDFDWQAGERNMLRALELNPQNSTVHLWRVHPLLAQRRFDEAIRHVERSIELDPDSFPSQIMLAYAYYFARRYEKAITVGAQIIARFPASSYAFFSQASFLRAADRFDEAYQAGRSALELAGDSPFVNIIFAQILAAGGRISEAYDILDQIEARPAGKDSFGFLISIIYCYSGEKEKALRSLEKAVADHDGLLIWIGIEPSFDILRDDDRFRAILRKINYPLI